MRAVVAILSIALLALAGCSGKSGPDPYTCQKTGRVIDLSQVEGSGKKGFDPESACPAPIPPSVAFTSLPAGMTAYYPATIAWAISTGNYTAGHSMLNELLWSHHPVADDQLQAPETYSTNKPLAMFAHQDVPAPFGGKVEFDTPGTYYLRVYAQVRGNGLPDTDFWTPEVKMVVNPVNATGKSVTVTHPPGVPAAGMVGTVDMTDVRLKLGDALVFKNDDVAPHDLTCSGPVNFDKTTVSPNSASAPIVFVVPGSYRCVTDDKPNGQTINVGVSQPT
jgi:hypothetical protein